LASFRKATWNISSRNETRFALKLFFKRAGETPASVISPRKGACLRIQSTFRSKASSRMGIPMSAQPKRSLMLTRHMNSPKLCTRLFTRSSGLSTKPASFVSTRVRRAG